MAAKAKAGCDGGPPFFYPYFQFSRFGEIVGQENFENAAS
jgi:hypothetical protein